MYWILYDFVLYYMYWFMHDLEYQLIRFWGFQRAKYPKNQLREKSDHFIYYPLCRSLSNIVYPGKLSQPKPQSQIGR